MGSFLVGSFVGLSPPATAHVSPSDCNTNALDLTFSAPSGPYEQGEVIEYQVVIENGGSGACDITNATVNWTEPAADGTATGTTHTLDSGVDLPANGSGDRCYVSGNAGDLACPSGTTEITDPSLAWTVNLDPSTEPDLAKAKAQGDGTLHDSSVDSDAQSQKTLTRGVEWHDLDVSKTANPAFDEECDWTIDKTASPTLHSMETGQSSDSTYTIDLTKSCTETNHRVSGEITITNPSDENSAEVDSVTDELSGGIMASVDCGGLPQTIAPGGTLTCTYSTSLPDNQTRTNFANVTTSGDVIDGGQGTATVDFTGVSASSTTNDEVTVDDTNDAGDAGPFTSSTSYTYDRTFTCDEDEGENPNQADVIGDGSTVLDSDNATVTVECTTPQLEVTKTTDESFDRQCDWTIDKTADPTSHSMETGQSAASTYTIVLDKTCEDVNHQVSGTINVTNPASAASAQIESVEDKVSGVSGNAAVSCPVTFPHTLGPGESFECTYTEDLPDNQTRTNTAWANVTADSNVSSGQDSEPVDFTGVEPTTITNDEVTVDDTNDAGDAGPFSADTSYTYDRTFTCDEDEGRNTNVADVIGDGDTVLDTDSADVLVECTTPQLQVTKTADPAFDREFFWDITKSVDNSSLTLEDGENQTVTYTIDLVQTGSEDKNHRVSGTINVTNPGSAASAEIESVEDAVSGVSGNAAVSCPVTFPHTLGPGESFECTYTEDLPDNQTRTNTAWANVTTASDVDSGSGTAEVNFTGVEPTETINETVNVDDTFDAGDFGPVSSSTTHTYERTYTCGEDEGEHPNTATIVETGQSDSASVTVECTGEPICGFTQGFWKTHGPDAKGNNEDVWPYENMTEHEGEVGLFLGDVFYNAEELQEIFDTPTKGDASMILAHQLIAAKLNVANGTDPNVTSGSMTIAEWITHADDLLTQANDESRQDELPFRIKRGELAEDMIEASEHLDDFNNRLLTPGCTPDVSVTKTPDTQTVDQGNNATWEITVTNSASVVVEAEDVSAVDTLPDGFEFNAESSSSACEASGENEVTCDLGKLAPGESATVTLFAIAGDGTCGETHTNVVEAFAKDELDDNRGDNTDTADVTVTCPA